MTIRYKCPECGAALNIKDELAGTQGHCPRCQVEFTVPAPEGNAVVEKEPAKKPAVAAGEPAVAKKQASGQLSEDDIEALLEGGGPESQDAGYGVADGDDDADDDTDHDGDESADARREIDDDETEDEDDDEQDARRKKKAKSKGKAGSKSDSSESAAIAKNLMARGERAAVREERKGGRPFGGTRDGRDEDREGHSAKEVVSYFATQAWPILLGGVAFMGLCYWISSSLFKKTELPPLAQVTGTVTLDGKPLEKAVVQFQPKSEGSQPNLRLGTSFGFTDADGKYSLVYLVDVPGAVIGKHYVMIKADDEKGAPRLPARYTNNSVLEAEVVKGGPPIDFALSSSAEPSGK